MASTQATPPTETRAAIPNPTEPNTAARAPRVVPSRNEMVKMVLEKANGNATGYCRRLTPQEFKQRYTKHGYLDNCMLRIIRFLESVEIGWVGEIEAPDGKTVKQLRQSIGQRFRKESSYRIRVFANKEESRVVGVMKEARI